MSPGLVPVERATDLVVDDASLEEIFLFLEIDHFAHPGEWIFGADVLFRQANLFSAAISHKTQILGEHLGI